jgi:hypothetical protein
LNELPLALPSETDPPPQALRPGRELLYFERDLAQGILERLDASDKILDGK